MDVSRDQEDCASDLKVRREIGEYSLFRPSLRALLPERVATLDVWVRLGDVSVVVAAALLSYLLRFGDLHLPGHYRVAIGTVLLYAVLCFTLSPLYRGWSSRTLPRDLGMAWVVWSVVFALSALHAVLVQLGNVLSRQWLGFWYLSGYGGLAIVRITAHMALAHMHRGGLDVQRVIAVGLRAPVIKLHQYLCRRPELGIVFAGYFATAHDRVRAGAVTPERLGALEDLSDYLETCHERIEQIWIGIPLSDHGHVAELMRLLERYPVPIKLVPDLKDYATLNPSVEQIGPMPIISLRQGVTHPAYPVIKRLEDWVVAGVAVIMLSPLFLVLAIGVKLSSPGPVFFRQGRNGLGGRSFQMLKFRSMRVHQESEGELAQAIRNDPRVTRFGAFLRRTSLDELPQFFNVLGGSMSVVGPRPHAIQHNNYYERLLDRYMQRHYVKPGITGWAQVNGYRGETRQLRAMKKRLQYDLHYIRHWSFWLDLRIIALTAIKMLGQKNAY